MRRFPILLCLAVALTGPAALRAQDGASGTSAPAAAPAPGTPESAPVTLQAEAAQTSSGLPEVAPPPRTLRAYWHVFIAFGLAWTLLFGYAIVLGRRFGALERQVKRLEGSGV
jgi:CcmD family protein